MESLFRGLLRNYFSLLPSAPVTLLKEKKNLNLSLPELLIGTCIGPHTIRTGTRSLLKRRDSRQKNVADVSQASCVVPSHPVFQPQTLLGREKAW